MAKKPRKITWSKRFKRFLIRLGFWSFYYFIGLLPPSWAYALGRAGGRIAAALPFGHRHTIFNNLNLAFEKEKSEPERRALAGRVFANIAEALVALIILCQESSPDIAGKVKIEGREHLEKALSKGSGVLAITGHMGLFVLITSRLNGEGYFSQVVTDYQYDPHLEKHIDEAKRHLGVRTIMTEPKDRCLQQSVDCLRRGGILVLLMDEDAKRRGIFVDFFGKPASTATGPAALALRTGAVPVPMRILYEGRGRHRLVIEPALELVKSGDFSADVAANTANFTRAIESMIRQHPDQWAWVNRRWKTRPKAESES